MITIYTRQNNKIVPVSFEAGQPMPVEPLWIDMLHPTEDEKAAITSALQIVLPTRSKMAEIESSSRLNTESGNIYLTTDILVGAETPNPQIDDLTIIITPSCLVTLRYSEPHAIMIYAHRLQQQPHLFTTQEDGLIAMLDAITDRTADVLEMIGRHIDDMSQQIFREMTQDLPEDADTKRNRRRNERLTGKHKEKHLQEILRGIGQAGDMNHKVRDCVNGIIRLIAFLEPLLTYKLSNEQMTKFRSLQRDVRSLAEASQYMSHEASFLLDATLGQINIEQNAIIKIFSVVAVVFLPPTLFASIWGMNFQFMPELNAPWGYGMAVAVMICSAIVPLLYFKHRGWL